MPGIIYHRTGCPTTDHGAENRNEAMSILLWIKLEYWNLVQCRLHQSVAVWEKPVYREESRWVVVYYTPRMNGVLWLAGPLFLALCSIDDHMSCLPSVIADIIRDTRNIEPDIVSRQGSLALFAQIIGTVDGDSGRKKSYKYWHWEFSSAVPFVQGQRLSLH